MLFRIYMWTLVLCASATQLHSTCTDIDGLLLFGDSYFDTGAGNAVAESVGVPLPNPTPTDVPPGPYFDGRHSNGPIWIDYTAVNLDLPVINYAVAGAETGSDNVNTNALGGLVQQVQRYASTTPTISPNTLVVIDGAGNDYLGLTACAPICLNPAQLIATTTTAITNLVTIIEEVEALGAQKIILWNLGDLSKLPLFNQSVTDPFPFDLLGPLAAAKPFFSAASAAFNANLPPAINQLNHFTGKKQVFIFDANTAFNELAAELAAQGIDIADFAYLSNYGGPYIPTGLDPATLAFYDQVHPTTYAWSLFANITSAYIDTIIEAPRFIASQVDLALETNKAHRDLVENHFRTLNVERYIYGNFGYNSCGCMDSCCCGQECLQVYADGEGKWGRTPNKCGQMGLRYDTGLALMGVDLRLTENITVGTSFTAQTTRARVNNGRGSMNLNDYIPTIYAAYFGPCFFIDTASSYHYYTFRNIKRNIPFLNRVARGRCDAMAGEWMIEGGYVAQCECFTMIPIIGLDVQTLTIRGYTERCAGFVNMTTNRQHQRSCISKIGGQVFWNAFDGCFIPFAEVFYEHEFLRNGRLMGPRFADSLDGAKDYNDTSAPNRDVLKYSLGLDARFACGIVGNISYIGDTNFREYTNAVRAQVDVPF